MNAAFDMDNPDRQETLMKTNEILIKEDSKWLYFASAHGVIITQQLEDVLPALREAEELVQVNHWHTAGFVSYEAASVFDSALRTRASSALLNENSSLRSHRPQVLSGARYAGFPARFPSQV
jgi:hypothetical protein